MRILVDSHFVMCKSMHSKAQMTINVGWQQRPLNTSSGRLAISTILWLYDYVSTIHPDVTIKDFWFCDDIGRSFRHDMYAGYKARRRSKEMTQAENEASSDMFHMKNVVLSFFAGLGCRVLKYNNLEADDVIGFISRVRSKNRLKTGIFTSDLDMAQLITQYTSVLRPVDNTIVSFTPVNLPYMHNLGPGKPYWGCASRPDVILFKTLCGDPSDDYVGVKGFGGAKWVQFFDAMTKAKMKSVDFLKNPVGSFTKLKSTDASTEKLCDIVLADIASFNLFKKIAMIRRDLEPETRECWYRHPDDEAITPTRIIVEPGDIKAAKKALKEYSMRKTLDSCTRILGV